VRRHVLPDVLEPGLAIVFCGTAAGAVAARVGAPYAGPGNRFWWVLHEVGLTPTVLDPQEFRELPRFGLGLTDAAKHVSGSDARLARSDFDAAAVRRKVERYGPRILAFVGKRAAREVLGGGVDYGRQAAPMGDSEVWVVPSTSGAARGAWDVGPWRDLARAATS
jgi:double-stranded uracil-DNA glycosylase